MMEGIEFNQYYHTCNNNDMSLFFFMLHMNACNRSTGNNNVGSVWDVLNALHHVSEIQMTCRLSSKPQLDDKECCILPNDVLPISKFRPFGLGVSSHSPCNSAWVVSPCSVTVPFLGREWARDNPSWGHWFAPQKTGCAKCKCVMAWVQVSRER